MELHKQVPAKVVCLIDEKIKPLVDLLNSIDPNLRTFDSCQGDSEKMAYVKLFYGDTRKPNSNETISFIHKFTDAMISVLQSATQNSSKGYDMGICAEWRGNMKSPTITIEIYPDEIDGVVNLISEVKEGYRSLLVEKALGGA